MTKLSVLYNLSSACNAEFCICAGGIIENPGIKTPDNANLENNPLKNVLVFSEFL
jgi:hypothetical protein